MTIDQGGPGLMAPGRLRPAGGGCEDRGEVAALPGHQPAPSCVKEAAGKITRLNSVKNTNFGLDNKILFLMH